MISTDEMLVLWKALADAAAAQHAAIAAGDLETLEALLEEKDQLLNALAAVDYAALVHHAAADGGDGALPQLAQSAVRDTEEARDTLAARIADARARRIAGNAFRPTASGHAPRFFDSRT